MRGIREWILRLGGLFNKRRKDRELDDEIESHLQMHIEDNLRLGMTPEEARRQAMIKLGGIESTKEAYRDQRGLPMLETLWQDVRYGARMLRKNPGFTAVAVLTLALGIGANTAIFSVLDKLLLRRLPVEEPQRLVTFAGDESFTWQSQVSVPRYAELRDRNDVLSGLIAFNGISLVLDTDGSAERINGEIVSGNFFSVLGAKMALGRAFLPEEDRTPGSHPVAIISYGLWQRRFGSDPNALGRSIRLNGHLFTIVGIASGQFTGTSRGRRSEIFIPMMMLGQLFPLEAHKLTQGDNWINLMGRLKPGVTRQQAQASLAVLALQLQQHLPENSRKRIFLADGSQGNTDRIRSLVRPVNFLAGMAGLVLFIACANLAHLLLARATARQREIAVRLALGASRGRIFKQLLTEGLLLSTAGGAVGLFFGIWSARLLSAWQPQIEFSVTLDWRLITFTLLLSLATGLVFGLMPAFQVATGELVSALKDRTAASGSTRRWYWVRQFLVVPQISLSLAVLICAGLCLRSLHKLFAIDVGFEPSSVLIVPLNLGDAKYDEARGRAFCAQVIERASALPGVKSAGLGQISPFGGGRLGTMVRPAELVEPIEFGFNRVGPKYFQTLGIPLLSGRDFAAQDLAEGPKVTIINETAARRFWLNGNAVGQHLHLRTGPTQWQPFEVVGVVGDSKSSKLTENVRPDMYVALSQFYSGEMTLHARTENASPGFTAALRATVRALDSKLPIEIRTLDERISGTLTSERMTSWLLTAFGLLSLILAGIGIYGVLAFAASQRTHEIGIRMALGAQRGDVLGLVLTHGMKLAGLGIIGGLGAAYGLTRMLRTLLFDVSPTDPITFVSISLLLTGATLLACWLPARRASKVDPMVALRHE